MKKEVPFLILLIVMLAGCSGTNEFSSTSPNGNIELIFILDDGAPEYMVRYKDEILIDTSRLGFIFEKGQPMICNFEIDSVKVSSKRRHWKPVWGEVNRVYERYNQLKLNLKETGEPYRILQVEFKVFNDGLGFRYIFPEQEHLKDFNIISEETQFRFHDDHSAWWIKGDYEGYERLFNNTTLSQINTANTPVTIETTGGLYVSLHEANLTDYAGMTLKRSDEDPLMLECDLVPWPDGIKVKATTPFQTPWRTIQIATEPGGLIESHLILNLNEPNKIEDVSWIHPMKYTGIWWGMHTGKYSWHSGPKHGATTENAKRYIDFNAENGIPGLLIEGWNKGWDSWSKGNVFDFISPYEDFDLNEVVRYAGEKGVRLIGHHETGGNIPVYEQNIDSAFKLYASLGIHAVKTGYAGRIKPEGYHHHGQWMVNHYREVVKKAAEYKIMIDAHEPIKPTGIRRTYPNMMTREGVRGMEYNAWSEGNPPEHTCILPFTRMLAGPLDYTPGIFDLFFNEYRPNRRVYTTLANQLALYVVLYSPLQMAADLPENYEGHPAFQFIKDVPCNWDDTKVLNGSIGDYVTIARKNRDDWFIGSITDENERELSIALSFLDKETEYEAVIYADGPDADWESNPYDYTITKTTLTNADTLSIVLARGGGQAIMLTAR